LDDAWTGVVSQCKQDAKIKIVSKDDAMIRPSLIHQNTVGGCWLPHFTPMDSAPSFIFEYTNPVRE